MGKIKQRFKTIEKSAGCMTALIAIVFYSIDKVLFHQTRLYFWYISLCIQKQLNSTSNMVKDKFNSDGLKGDLQIGDKMPIWVFWMQGEDKMPELVHMCYKQLNKMVDDTCKVMLITNKSIQNFVDINPVIMKKVKSGNYSLTQLSDLLRVKLLAKYGGLWIDSTVFVSKKINKQIIEDGFFSQKFTINNPLSKFYASQNKWSLWLMGAKPESFLFNYCDKKLTSYYTNVTSSIDYYLLDYIILNAYHESNTVKTSIDDMPDNNQQTYRLMESLNDKYNSQSLYSILKECQFHKLSYKEQLKKVSDGKYTNYGILLKRVK